MPIRQLFRFLPKMMIIASVLSVTQANPQTVIGIELYSFRNQFAKDVPGTLQKISKMGITEIEGGGTYGLPAEEYKKMLAQNNLKMISWGADFAQLSNPQLVADQAKSFGATYVVCFWIPHNGKEFTIADVTKAIKIPCDVIYAMQTSLDVIEASKVWQV